MATAAHSLKSTIASTFSNHGRVRASCFVTPRFDTSPVVLCPGSTAGLFLFGLDANFKMQAHLLAIRPICPHHVDDRKVTAGVVKKWAVQVLGQPERRESYIARVITGGGTGANGGVGQAWEWER